MNIANIELQKGNIVSAIKLLEVIVNENDSYQEAKANLALAYRRVGKINRALNINSCFKICISQKIIFSIFGFDVKIICGVKNLKNKTLDGHAWLSYNQKPMLGPNENIDQYIESFTV